MSAQYLALARRALAPYGFDPAASAQLINLSENATFELRDGARSAILRVHRQGYHSFAEIRSELAWLAAVRSELRVPVPVPIPTVSGDLVCVLHDPPGDPRYAVLFERLPGAEPPPDDLDARLPELGSIAATLHLHTRRWRPPVGFTRFAWTAQACIGPQGRWGRVRDGIGVGRSEAALFEAVASQVLARLRSYGTGPDRFGLIHADMRLANLLVDGSTVSVIDFDDSGYGWHLFDLAATLSFVEHDERIPRWCALWLSGYQRVRPLHQFDRDMVGTFIMLRRLMLVAWLGSHDFTDLSQQLGVGYTGQTCDLGDAYLANSGWAREVSG